MSKTGNTSPETGKYVRRFWRVILIMTLCVVLLISSISLGLFGDLPSFRDLENPKSNLASEVISADRVVLGTYYVQNRSNSSYKDLSPNLINALIATEDIRFYTHSGIDLKGTFAIIVYNIAGKKRGSSTITQQLAKNLFPRQRQTLLNITVIKLKEWLTAIKIERNYTKEEILTMYFNTVDFGSNSYGIKSAAKTYFGKNPSNLKIEEAALLVGILKGTSYFSPVKHPDRALARRNVVIGQLEKYGYLTEAQSDSIKALPIQLKFESPEHSQGLATYFREYIRLELNKWCEENKKPDGTRYDLYRDGLKIYTTINSTMQRYAEEALREHLSQLQNVFYEHWKGRTPWGKFTEILTLAMKRTDRYKQLDEDNVSEDSIMAVFNTPVPMKVFSWKGPVDTIMSPMDSIKYYKYFLRSSLMAMEPQTGHVKAWVGGNDYKYFQYDQVKGKRQVGSTFKPFVYTVAIDNGWSPCIQVPNLPVVFEDFNNYSPKNSDNKEGGMLTLRKGLANSVNHITAYLMKQFGPKPIINVAHKMGITSEIDPYPSIALGTADISLYDMVGAYTTFANKGIWTEPIYIIRVEDKNGNVLFERFPKRKDAISEESAYVMLDMMKGVIDGGTGWRLRGPKYRIPYPIAGKTGTTQNNSDGWFIGITPDLVSGVWTGAEDRSVSFRSTNLGEGANTALPIWAIFMKKIYADTRLNISKGDFEKPENPLPVEIDCSKYQQENIQGPSTEQEPSLDF